jgi:anti-sigma-K factor RskA
MTNGIEEPHDMSLAAGEYVLGLMDDAARADFEVRLATDPELRRLVAFERERFLELDLTASGPAPSADLWQRIEQDVARTPAPSNVVDLDARRRQSAATSSPTGPSRRGFWQGFAAASVLGLIASGVAYMQATPQPPRLVVVLLNDQAQPVSLVEALDDKRIRVVPLAAIDVPSNRTLQVWTLPDPATGPVSMGLLETVRATLLEGPVLPSPRPDQLYEITLEPAGGSPTGRPTGPIIGKGYARTPRI